MKFEPRYRFRERESKRGFNTALSNAKVAVFKLIWREPIKLSLLLLRKHLSVTGFFQSLAWFSSACRIKWFKTKSAKAIRRILSIYWSMIHLLYLSMFSYIRFNFGFRRILRTSMSTQSSSCRGSYAGTNQVLSELEMFKYLR